VVGILLAGFVGKMYVTLLHAERTTRIKETRDLAGWNAKDGVMSLQDSYKLYPIGYVATQTGKVFDQDLDWMLSRMQSPPLVDTPGNRTLLHMKVVLRLKDIDAPTAGQEEKIYQADMRLMTSAASWDRRWGINLAWNLDDPRALSRIRQLSTSDPDPNVRYAATNALALWNGKRPRVNHWLARFGYYVR